MCRFYLYRPVSGSRLEEAKLYSKHRERVPTPIWQVLLFIIGFIVPVINVLSGAFCVAWGLPENSSEFHLYKTNAIARFIDKIVNFLNKSIW